MGRKKYKQHEIQKQKALEVSNNTYFTCKSGAKLLKIPIRCYSEALFFNNFNIIIYNSCDVENNLLMILLHK